MICPLVETGAYEPLKVAPLVDINERKVYYLMLVIKNAILCCNSIDNASTVVV